MSEFLSLLNKFMKRVNCTSASLSRYIDVDITLFSKIKNGTRKLQDSSKLPNIISILQLTEKEKDDFISAYKKDMLGEETYAKLLTVKQLLEQVGRYSMLTAHSTFNQSFLTDTTAYSNADVLILIKQLLEIEIHKKKGYIKLITQPEFTSLNLLLQHILREDISIDIIHIIALQISKSEESIRYNIHNIMNVFPLILSYHNYVLKYYYDEIVNHFNSHSFFPFLIITSEYTININHDLSLAHLSTNKEIHDLYEREFDKISKNTHKIIHELKTPLDMITHYQLFERTPFSNLYTMELQPCFNLFIDNEIIQSCVSSTLPGIERILSEFHKRRESLINLRDKFEIYSYFTKEGIIDFMENGYFSEVPKAFCQPLPIEKRIIMLERVYNAIMTDETLHYNLINLDKFHYPSNLVLSGWDNNQISFIYKNPESNNICFTLNERNISSSIIDFCKYLEGSTLIYTKEETNTFLFDIISKFRQ